MPLNHKSQSTPHQVLYYNANAPLEAIYQCATARIHAVTNLLENLYPENMTENTITAIAKVSILLLNDAKLLLEELDPIAIMLRNEA